MGERTSFTTGMIDCDNCFDGMLKQFVRECDSRDVLHVDRKNSIISGSIRSTMPDALEIGLTTADVCHDVQIACIDDNGNVFKLIMKTNGYCEKG